MERRNLDTSKVDKSNMHLPHPVHRPVWAPYEMFLVDLRDLQRFYDTWPYVSLVLDILIQKHINVININWNQDSSNNRSTYQQRLGQRLLKWYDKNIYWLIWKYRVPKQRTFSDAFIIIQCAVWFMFNEANYSCLSFCQTGQRPSHNLGRAIFLMPHSRA